MQSNAIRFTLVLGMIYKRHRQKNGISHFFRKKMIFKHIIITVSVALFVSNAFGQEGFCPPKSHQVCIRASNQCCSDSDCPVNEICCQENCGNTCHPPDEYKSTGMRIFPNNACKLDSRHG